jgi:hypothetical protein
VPVLWAIGIVFALVGAILWVDEGTGAPWAGAGTQRGASIET